MKQRGSEPLPRVTSVDRLRRLFQFSAQNRPPLAIFARSSSPAGTGSSHKRRNCSGVMAIKSAVAWVLTVAVTRQNPG
jgi:hypothetical protein